MTNKRLLKQQYLATPTRAGIYAIRNGVTGRVLLAASTDANGALNRHRFELRRGAHRNRLLSQDWARDGEASFSFDVLDTVKLRDDPAFDLAAELKDLLALWREELAGETAGSVAFYEAAA
ncbi:MAG: GIY-YIG nuclease family protein [Telluria sp.]